MPSLVLRTGSSPASAPLPQVRARHGYVSAEPPNETGNAATLSTDRLTRHTARQVLRLHKSAVLRRLPHRVVPCRRPAPLSSSRSSATTPRQPASRGVAGASATSSAAQRVPRATCSRHRPVRQRARRRSRMCPRRWSGCRRRMQAGAPGSRGWFATAGIVLRRRLSCGVAAVPLTVERRWTKVRPWVSFQRRAVRLSHSRFRLLVVKPRVWRSTAHPTRANGEGRGSGLALVVPAVCGIVLVRVHESWRLWREVRSGQF